MNASFIHTSLQRGVGIAIFEPSRFNGFRRQPLKWLDVTSRSSITSLKRGVNEMLDGANGLSYNGFHHAPAETLINHSRPYVAADELRVTRSFGGES